jgi:hypothetical protein
MIGMASTAEPSKEQLAAEGALIGAIPTTSKVPQTTDVEAKVQPTITSVAILGGVSLFIKEFIDDFRRSSSVGKYCTLVAFFIVLLSMIISIVYLSQALEQASQSQLIANPLNIQSADYSVSKSSDFFNFFGTKYKYQLFIILPIIAFVLLLIAFFHSPLEGIIKGIAIACLIQVIIALIANTSAYSYAHKSMHLVSQRIKDFNNFIHNNIYKTAAFLAPLKEIPTNSMLVIKTVEKSLNAIEASPSVDTLASAFFTLNLYFHIQKIGFRNENITEAVKIFDIHSLLIGSSLKDKINIINTMAALDWSPADYLYHNSTFIEDYSMIMKNIYLSIPGNKVPLKTVEVAINKVQNLLAEANNRANTLYPEDSWNKFLHMAITILIIQTVPILILIYLFRKESVRNGFFNFIKMLHEMAMTKTT